MGEAIGFHDVSGASSHGQSIAYRLLDFCIGCARLTHLSQMKICTRLTTSGDGNTNGSELLLFRCDRHHTPPVKGSNNTHLHLPVTACLLLIPNCGNIDSSVPPSRPSTAPISHWTTVRFCNECPSGALAA